MFLMGVFFVISFQPLFMVSSLILITLMYSYLIYKITGTFWFSYILLMVMMSGVLVVFTYMVSLIPNESFEIYSLMFFFSFLMMMLLNFNFFFLSDMSFISMNLWMTELSYMNLFLVSFLLVIMLLVVYMSYMEEGAFRV
uniref:NADH dehydrogenase subunit 6 n=1 Tax=Oxytate striatipes TaxID=1112455 RepID=A0A0U1XGP6_OXYST|nr:NADH dehydrogenase subunit 6 [Oxytate striatipes]AIT96926.1 NADH dehydrogenase subunit 6 [Oxytate striatipes]